MENLTSDIMEQAVGLAVLILVLTIKEIIQWRAKLRADAKKEQAQMLRDKDFKALAEMVTTKFETAIASLRKDMNSLVKIQEKNIELNSKKIAFLERRFDEVQEDNEERFNKIYIKISEMVSKIS